ncbi:hypothetical protein FO519_006770 [Halicephalobus sp. NKZ332]|nr:hypothetical protein FO519_006770 [Halicephalobus sp. NKZ332]
MTPTAGKQISKQVNDKIIKFENIGGFHEVKQKLKEVFLWQNKYGKLYQKCGLRLGGGAILHGPSGNGKSLLMRGLAAESKMNVITVKGPELLSKYIGASEQNVRDVFERTHRCHNRELGCGHSILGSGPTFGPRFISGSRSFVIVTQTSTSIPRVNISTSYGNNTVIASVHLPPNSFISNVRPVVLSSPRWEEQPQSPFSVPEPAVEERPPQYSSIYPRLPSAPAESEIPKVRL